jgi:DNA-binding MarR family transcriptional regulator
MMSFFTITSGGRRHVLHFDPDGTKIVPVGTTVNRAAQQGAFVMTRSVRLPQRAPEPLNGGRSLDQLLPVLLARNGLPYGYRIGYLSNYFSGPIYSVLEQKHGMRRPKFATLFCLAHLGPMSATEIGLLTGIPKNSLSRAVNELQKERLLRREVDRSDSRRAILTITPGGRRLFERLLPLFQARQTKMLSALDKTDLQALDRVLTKLILRTDDWAESY